jgi:tryptophanase
MNKIFFKKYDIWKEEMGGGCGVSYFITINSAACTLAPLCSRYMRTYLKCFRLPVSVDSYRSSKNSYIIKERQKGKKKKERNMAEFRIR